MSFLAHEVILSSRSLPSLVYPKGFAEGEKGYPCPGGSIYACIHQGTQILTFELSMVYAQIFTFKFSMVTTLPSTDKGFLFASRPVLYSPIVPCITSSFPLTYPSIILELFPSLHYLCGMAKPQSNTLRTPADKTLREVELRDALTLRKMDQLPSSVHSFLSAHRRPATQWPELSTNSSS